MRHMSIRSMDKTLERARALLLDLYGQPAGHSAALRLVSLIDEYRPLLAPQPVKPVAGLGLTGKDALLIAYGDQLRKPGVPPLQVLVDFCERRLVGLLSGVHLLPFYPFSSDDGFSVINYRAVDPALGTWEDIARLGRNYRLMFDAVINHVSAHSRWFQAFLRDDPRFDNYFITVSGDPDLSQVVRPRALPLLTHFETPSGPKRLWTTFSADQIDLNYTNPEVLLEILEVLLFYILQGADFLRLDAIAYLWKEIGTPCIHLRQTHQVVQLMRALIDAVAPHVKIITETNVPHADNLAYFGDGTDEAHLVYNFALPPLVLHTFLAGDARILSEWVASLALPSDQVVFFNFLASHDGIGLNPARGILSDSQIDALVSRALAHGGLVSQKDNPDGTQSPYELNINYLDALSNPQAAEPTSLQAARFLAAQAILLSLAGLPGIYFHSLVGSRGWPEGVQLTGHKRTINRQKLDLTELETELVDPRSLRHRIFHGYAQLLSARAAHPAFHPLGAQQVLDLGASVFALLRVPPDGARPVLCLVNVTHKVQDIHLDLRRHLGPAPWRDLITSQPLQSGGKRLALEPYQCSWITA